METIHILTAGVTAIILFIFGLQNFSREIEKISGENFRNALGNATRIPVVGVLIGAVVTALIQSSSATSVITIGLVNAGVLSFRNSVGIIFGSNIGTTITAQLVAFKLTAFAPLIIILGFALSLIRTRYSVFGKAIFYFGFVFFSLNLISASLQPLQYNATFVDFLTQPQNPFLAILVGCVFTALLQSSSVTTGLAIIFTQQGLLGLENAVPLIMGANIGTTSTALIAMFNMDTAAKKTALSHFLFNIGGVLIFLPLLLVFGNRLGEINLSPAVALANIHLIFNLVASLIFILLLGPFVRLVDWLLGEGKMDYERLHLPHYDESRQFDEIREDLEKGSAELLSFLRENYNLVTLSIESNYASIFEAAGKRIDYVEFVKKGYLRYFSHVVSQVHDEKASKELIGLINQIDYLFQIHDSIEDLFETKKVMAEHYIELRSDILLLIRAISNRTLALFDELSESLADTEQPIDPKVAKEMQAQLDEAQRKLMTLLADTARRDAGAMTNFVTYSQRLKDKLVNYARVRTESAAS